MNGGLMGQIANPAMADIVGAQDYRQRKLREDEQLRRQVLARQAVSQALTGGLAEGTPMYQLAEADPEQYLLFTKAMGIPVGDGAKMQQAVDDTYYLSALPPRDAFTEAHRLYESRMQQGYESPHLRLMMESAMRDGPGVALNALKVFADSANRLGGNQVRVQSTQDMGNGITKMVLSDGNVVVKDAKNQILTGDRAISEIEAAAEAVARREGSKSKARAAGTIAGKMEGEPDLVAANEAAKGNTTRSQDFINRGVVAAESIPTIKRAISLLGLVETGGFNQAQLRAKQAFGIESADEGELSANLGKAVLSQLRETFGSQFTEKEGERLERIEAGFGKSSETNKRLLMQLLEVATTKANRGLKAAQDQGDDFTAQDIQNYLAMSLDPEPETKKAGGGNSGIEDLINKWAPE